MKKSVSAVLCLLLMLSFMITASAEGTEISYGADYDLVTPASEAYPDDGIKLTDGVYGTHAEGLDGYYAGGAYVGFNKADINSNGKFVVIVDLGKVYDNITELTVGYLSETIVGISAPQSVNFAISEERNGTYAELGSVETTPEDTDTSATYAKSLKPNENVTGRFVMVTITPSGYTDDSGVTNYAPWTFIDEISIRAASDDGETSETSETSDVSEVSDVSETSDIVSEPTEDEADTPQTGDGTAIFAFVLLAIASITMMFALFTVKRNREF